MFHDTAATAGQTAAEINADGLTYRRKPIGSPFNGGSGMQGQAMSCFLCGCHRPRSKLRSRLLVGRHHAVCAPSCQALDAVEATGHEEIAAEAGT